MWGDYLSKRDYLTDWTVLGGPVIGIHYDGFIDWKGNSINLSLIVGDRCRPKYLGARKLNVRLGERREVKFYWQESYAEYFSACLSKGFFYIQNMELLDWVDIGNNKGLAVIFPSF